VPLFPGFDSLGALAHITREGDDHSWFVLNERIIAREFALSGSEQNPDLTERSIKLVLGRIGKGAPAPVRRFVERGADFVTARTLGELAAGMNRLTATPLIDAAELEREIVARDREIDNQFGKDAQVMAIRAARHYLGDKLIRVAKPHRILDSAAGPLIAVKLHVLTRKTLGGLETDLSSRVLQPGGEPLPGLYAAGEVAGFGGGGVHGYRALEGTFLGGCIFSGRIAGREAARVVA
jgi:predicted oxidoreductase